MNTRGQKKIRKKHKILLPGYKISKIRNKRQKLTSTFPRVIQSPIYRIGSQWADSSGRFDYAALSSHHRQVAPLDTMKEVTREKYLFFLDRSCIVDP